MEACGWAGAADAANISRARKQGYGGPGRKLWRPRRVPPTKTTPRIVKCGRQSVGGQIPQSVLLVLGS